MTQKISKASNAGLNKGSHAVSAEERYRMIAEAAYYRALNRPFDGNPLDDWLQAEQEVNRTLLHAEPVAQRAPARAKRAERSRTATARAN